MSSKIEKVNLDSNVYEMIVNHALSNEKEEVMGLLIGNIENDPKEPKKCFCNIHMSLILERLDKRADRVEISPEQLTLAAEFAEKLSIDFKTNIHIIGWYHSHPRITVFPSHVDIKTQFMYQMMDKNFIGIIVSVYNQNKQNLSDNIELICFQSIEENFVQIPINVCVNDEKLVENNFQTLFKIPTILAQEENNLFKKFSENNPNILCNMSNVGIYLHSMSQIIDISYLDMINTLKCRIELNDILLKNSDELLNNEAESIE